MKAFDNALAKTGNRTFSRAIYRAVRRARRSTYSDVSAACDFIASMAGATLPDRALINGALRQVRG